MADPVLERIVAGRGRADVIAVLRDAQQAFGCLPPSLLEEIAACLGMTYAEVFGIVSFYEHFHCEPRGRYLVRVCRGTACHVRGAEEIVRAVERTLGISEGETTSDGMFTLSTVACLGTCSLAPVMMVGDRYYGKMTPERVPTVFAAWRESAPAVAVARDE